MSKKYVFSLQGLQLVDDGDEDEDETQMADAGCDDVLGEQLEVEDPPVSLEPRYISEPELKSSTIMVDDLTIAISKNRENEPVVTINVSMGPLKNGMIPEVVFDEGIIIDESLRKSTITSVIQTKMINMYPEMFYPDPEVIINNYSVEFRKDSSKFDLFKEDVLDILDIAFE